MEPIFTPEELAQVHAYNAPLYAWSLLQILLKLALFAWVLHSGVRLNHRFSQWAAVRLGERLAFTRRIPVLRVLPVVLDRLWGGSGWGAALVFCQTYLVFFLVAFLPTDLYFDYFHPHRFGLSNLTPGGYAVDRLKALALSAAMTAALTFGLYGLARRLRFWWLVLGVAVGPMLLVSGVLDPQRGKLYFDQRPLEPGPLRDGIAALTSRAEVEYRDVVVENLSRVTRKANAYFAGQGPTRTVVLSDTLVEHLGQEEILAAVAHELAHVRESEWPRRLLSALGLLGFLYLLHLILRVSAEKRWFSIERYGDVRTLPLFGLALLVVGLVGQPFSSAESRARERAADLYALELTENPEAFRSLLVKLTRLNQFDPEPPAWISWRFSHPTVQERLEGVDAFEQRKKTSDR